ncbi:MAG TPA: PAS domain S-box protein [Candidatus Dormibacteraeota bacterium]|nr:PAS domain S-box protein [Candidatus Dormibacteraeota bacterium]
MLREAAMSVARALHADCATVHELAGADGRALLRAEVGPPGQLGWTVVGDDVVVRATGFHSILTARVRPNGRVWGVVSAFARRPDAFDPQDALVMESIANVLATAIDRKSAGDAFRSWEARFAAGFESSLLGSLIVGPDSRLLEVNRAFGDMLGYEPDELVGVSFLGITPAGDAAVNARQFQGMLELSENRVRTTKRFLHRDGHIVHVELNVVSIHPPEGGSRCFFVQAQDITDRLRAETARAEAEHALRSRELTFSQIFMGNPLPMWLFELDGGRFLEVNAAVSEKYGYRRDELVSMRVQDIRAPEDAARLEEFIDALRRDGSAYSDSGLWTHLRRDGTAMEVNIYSHRVPYRGHDAALMIAYDLTARRQAESALRESEERLRTLVVNVPVVLFALDRRGTLISAEGRALRTLGLRTADIVGHSAFSVYPDHELVRSVLTRALEGEEFSTVVEIGDVTLEGSFRPLLDENGTVREVIGVATDISERTRAESELRRRIAELHLADEERRRLLGHLVTAQEEERRRVANHVHDEALPTIAAAIMLVGQLGDQLPGREEAETLRSIEEALAAAVHQLRHLIGGLRPPGLDHGRLVPAIRAAARSTFPAEVEVTVTGELATEPRGAAREVMYRIAQEALANCRTHAGATRVEVDLADVDGGVRVTIRDDGRGFDAGDTAESPALGHLGIISMRERAELVGGRWQIRSRPGAGTVVEYWLPSHRDHVG